jgi:hypothetical protein
MQVADVDPGPRVVRCVEAGTGEPAVVLEAGLNNGAASWERVMPRLAPHLRVAAYDRAGLGGSAPGRGLPRRFRANWTRLQAGLAASAPQGRHIVVDRTGHNIPGNRPDVVASTILEVASLARAGRPARQHAR